MYVLSDVTPPVAAVTTAVVLPSTGIVNNNVVTIAIALLVGMTTWGVMYARANR